LYDSGRKEKEGIVDEILKARKNLVSPLNKRIEKLKVQINEMWEYLTNMKIEHLSGQIGDAAYETTYEAIQRALTRALAEQKDLEASVEALMNPVQIAPPISNQESGSFEGTEAAKPSRPLVLRIKEAIS
jgi:predicted  nucleic acid-binding Zn-ribbon protein